MSLAHAYRSQLALRQSRRLLGYVALAVILHGGAWLLGSRVWSRTQPQPLPEELTSIEFVYVAPQNAAAAPAQVTQRRAQVTATATKAQENRSMQMTQSGGASRLPSGSAVVSPAKTSAPTPSNSTPARSFPSLPQTPLPAKLPAVPSTAASSSVLEATPQPSPEPPSPISALPSPGAGFSGARQLGGPLTAAGTSVDAIGDPLWGPYMDTVNRQVDQHWQRLSVPQTRRAKVRFRIDRQGRLSEMQLLQSSGDPLTDQAAIEAIRDAAPFAPLPQDATEEILIVNFTFTYHGVEVAP